MRFLAVSIAALALAAGAWGQSAPKKKTTTTAKTKARVVPHTATSKSTTTRSSTSRPATSKTGSKTTSKTAAKSRKTTVVARRPPTQQQPTADRYKEIQQALMDKGYFQGPVDGAWNPGSVDALKRFQKDQNLDADGKIGSLSLIALGLGPKRGVASAQAAPGASEPADPPPAVQPQQ